MAAIRLENCHGAVIDGVTLRNMDTGVVFSDSSDVRLNQIDAANVRDAIVGLNSREISLSKINIEGDREVLSALLADAQGGASLDEIKSKFGDRLKGKFDFDAMLNRMENGASVVALIIQACQVLLNAG